MILHVPVILFLHLLLMTCFHPLVAEKVKTFSQTFDATGKKFKKINILGAAENILDVPDYCSGAAAEYFCIPCGRCIGCRIDKARDWSVRIMCEASTCERSSWFLTLTYDNDHMDSFSLNKKHFQDFIKDLRNYLSYKFNYSVRYFGCGEYGDTSGRRTSFAYNFI